MESDVSFEFRDFCKKEGIYVYRNKKLNVPVEQLSGTAGIVLKIKDRKIKCKIYFGRNIKEEIVLGLFDVLSDIGVLYALELVDLPFIPKKVEKLYFLESLGIYSSHIINLPEEMSRLVQLKELVLRIDNLRYMPEWMFDFINLEILDLFGTKITEIPDKIRKLKNLKILDLSCTNLKEISRDILDLDLEFKDYFNEKDAPGIYFCDSTCEKPSTEIIFGGRERLKFYYSSNEIVSQNVVRVILLGQKGAGKTSMVQRMKELEYRKPYFEDHNSWTQGISINKIKCKKGGILHIWDFGGQEMMLSTHTLFLRDHCIYVIVLNARQGDEPERWLDYINQYGRNSSVFIVNNHMDVADTSQVDVNKLKRLYSNLSIINNKIWEISCKRPERFPLDDFYGQLIYIAEQYFNQKITLSWNLLNLKLGEMKKGNESVNYITHEEYLNISEECGINRMSEKLEALNWLNEIGTVFTYGNPVAINKVNEFKVLNPLWVTDAIYKIVNYMGLQKETCVVLHDEIRTALLNGKSENKTENKYSDSEIVFILEIMRKFYLSFCCSETKEFIPAIAKNQEFKEVMDWTENQEEIILDVLYNISQDSNKRSQVNSVNLTYFYQVIVKIVEKFEKIPRMWRFGALFEDMCGMQILIFLQNKGKWDYEMRLMIKSTKVMEDRLLAANFHQCISSYLGEFAKGFLVDVKVLIRSNEEYNYFSVDTASKTLLNKDSCWYYDPRLDNEINLFDDVLNKVTPNSIEQIKEVIEQLRIEVKEGTQKTGTALSTLNEIWKHTSSIHFEMLRYNETIEERDTIWLDKYLQAVYDSQELKNQLQLILDTVNLQNDKIIIIKELVNELCNKKSEKKGIIEMLKGGTTALSTGVTLATADYKKIEDLFEILRGIVDNVISQV